MKILIIDDDLELCMSLKKSLQNENFVVDLSHSGTDGSYEARTNRYDLIIIDYYIPDIKGDIVCKEIRNSNKGVKILILSGEPEIDNKIKMLNLGADDYMVKPFSYLELLSRIKALTRRNGEINKNILKAGDITIDMDRYTVFRKKKRIYLTKKELSLLELLVKNKGYVMSRSMIMEYIWSKDFDPFSNTIETHITNIRKKLGFADRYFIENIPGVGYKIDV